MGLRRLLLTWLLLPGAPGAAPPHDGWEQAAFDRVARGELEGIAFLGFSAGGSRYAWVRAEVGGASGILTIDAVQRATAGGAELDHYRFHSEPVDVSTGPDFPNVFRQRGSYEAFLARERAAGIGPRHTHAWKRDQARLISPDGKLTLGWRGGPERGGAEDAASGRVFAATLEDVELRDQAVLFELFQGSFYEGGPWRSEPTFAGAYSSDDGKVFSVISSVLGGVMCWDANEYYAQVFSVARFRAGKPAREANAAGMAAYRAGKHREAQAAFRRALEIDPQNPRARYNLGAVSARLGDDAEVVRVLAPLGKANADLLRFKIATDADFSGARQRPAIARFIEKLGGVRTQPSVLRGMDEEVIEAGQLEAPTPAEKAGP